VDWNSKETGIARLNECVGRLAPAHAKACLNIRPVDVLPSEIYDGWLMRKRISFVVLLLSLLSYRLSGQGSRNTLVISVDATHPGTPISPQMFGIFFEDINFGADGAGVCARVRIL
jgi:hypothetical protein